jgi:triosephosphate isomerase
VTKVTLIAGRNKEVITSQLSHGLQGVSAQEAEGIVVAYEPVSAAFACVLYRQRWCVLQ